MACLDAMVEGHSLKSSAVEDLRTKLPKGVLGDVLKECAAVHEPVRAARSEPPFDFFGSGGDLSSPAALDRLRRELLETVAALIVKTSSLRVKLWHFDTGDGPFKHLLAEVDIHWRGRVERVVFELPVWAGSLTAGARSNFENAVDLTSAETRMRELFEEGEKVIKEARYLYEIGKLSTAFTRVNKAYLAIKLRLYGLVFLLNVHMMLSTSGDGSLRFGRAERGAGAMTMVLAVPVMLGYLVLALYSTVCKFKSTVDAHVADALAAGDTYLERAFGDATQDAVSSMFKRVAKAADDTVGIIGAQRRSSLRRLESYLGKGASKKVKVEPEEEVEPPKGPEALKANLQRKSKWLVSFRGNSLPLARDSDLDRPRKEDSGGADAVFDAIEAEGREMAHMLESFLQGDDDDALSPLLGSGSEAEVAMGRIQGWELLCFYIIFWCIYSITYEWKWRMMGVVTAVLFGLVLPPVLRARVKHPKTTLQLVLVALYDAMTGDLNVGGNCVFFFVAVSGLAWRYAWILLLLDILLISDDLQNVLNSIWIPRRSLVLAFYITLVSIAILSVLTFYFAYADDRGGARWDDDHVGVARMAPPKGTEYDDYVGDRGESLSDYVCVTPWTCFVRDVYVGLIDGQLMTATLGMDYFDGLDPSDAFKRQANAPRIIIQVIFFIFVTLLLINVFTGIILDTFSSLREMLNERKEKAASECFVCGCSRETLEEYDIDKDVHETKEHNKWSYLLYLDHVKRMASDVVPLTGVDAHVAAQLDSKEKLQWLPENSSFKLEQLNEDGEYKAKIDHDVRPLYEAIIDVTRHVQALRNDLDGRIDGLEKRLPGGPAKKKASAVEGTSPDSGLRRRRPVELAA